MLLLSQRLARVRRFDDLSDRSSDDERVLVSADQTIVGCTLNGEVHAV